MSLVVASPASLVSVEDTCASIEAWADTCESIPELKDAANKLAAIDEYLDLTSRQGRGRVAAAMRRLEVRIGKLLGPAHHGGDRKSDQVAREPLDLTAKQRHDFRKMADNEDTVEAVIAESSDDAPASRAKVKDALPQPKPRRGSLPDASAKAAWNLRKAVERVERIVADDRYFANREQVAAHLRGHLSYAVEVCQDLLDGFDQQEMNP